MLEGLKKEKINVKLETLSRAEKVGLMSMFQDYYDGKHFMTRTFSSDYGKSGAYEITTRSGTKICDVTNNDIPLVKMNWCRPIIETIGDYTRGVNEEVVVETESEKLKEIWSKNSIGVLLQEIAYGAGINGSTFVRLRRRNNTSPFEIFQVDPRAVHETFDPFSGDRVSVVFFYLVDAEAVKDIYPKISLPNKQVFYAEEWTNERVYKYLNGQQIEDRTINPYGCIPFFKVKANLYEASDIKDTISLNDDLNIKLTYNAEAVKYHAFPLLAPKNLQGTLTAEEMRNIEITPRAMLNFSAERITAGDIPPGLLEDIKQINERVSIVSGVPIKLLTAGIDGNTSGVAMQRMMSSVLKQAEIRRVFIRDTFIEISENILSLLGEDAEVDFVFPDLVAADTEGKIEEALKKQALGVSEHTLLAELGYDYEEEQALKEQETDSHLNRIQKELNEENNQTSKKQGVKAGEKDAVGNDLATQGRQSRD